MQCSEQAKYVGLGYKIGIANELIDGSVSHYHALNGRTNGRYYYKKCHFLFIGQKTQMMTPNGTNDSGGLCRFATSHIRISVENDQLKTSRKYGWALKYVDTLASRGVDGF